MPIPKIFAPHDGALAQVAFALGDVSAEAKTVFVKLENPEERTLSPGERIKADKILQFHNGALQALSGGHYALPGIINAHAQFYMDTWHLPKRPKMPARRNARKNLEAPKGLFTEDEAKALADALLDMDKALDAMLERYRELAGYVADYSIRDNGEKGRELAQKIFDGHAQFMKARDTWLNIVETRAQNAENELLRDHPLQRQILCAQIIFAQQRQIALVLKENEPDKAILEGLYRNILNQIENGGKPPFPAAPALERLYRAFLRQAEVYAGAMKRGIDEGFYAVHKRSLNEAAANCRKAYNEFARLANRVAEFGERAL